VELAETGDPLTEALQKERGRSAVFLASKPGTDAARQAERAGRERAVGASLIRSGNFDLPTLQKIAGLGGQQDAYFNEALAMLNAGDSLRASLEALPNSAASESLQEKRDTLFSSPSGMYALDAGDWFTTTTQRISELNGVREEMLAIR